MLQTTDSKFLTRWSEIMFSLTLIPIVVRLKVKQCLETRWRKLYMLLSLIIKIDQWDSIRKALTAYERTLWRRYSMRNKLSSFSEPLVFNKCMKNLRLIWKQEKIGKESWAVAGSHRNVDEIWIFFCFFHQLFSKWSWHCVYIFQIFISVTHGSFHQFVTLYVHV